MWDHIGKYQPGSFRRQKDEGKALSRAFIKVCFFVERNGQGWVSRLGGFKIG